MRKNYIYAFLVILPLFFISSCAETKKPESKTNNRIQTNYQITFIELGSVKCVPCKMMQPVMEEIEKEYAAIVKVIFYDVWTPEGRPMGMKYNVRSIPTQVFLDNNGQEIFRHMGYFPKEEIVKFLESKGVKPKK